MTAIETTITTSVSLPIALDDELPAGASVALTVTATGVVA